MTLNPLGRESHLETLAVLKAVNAAEAALGELKGIVKTIPNEVILLSTLPLQEAHASSAIENIITTQDELYRSHVDSNINGPAREVRAHADALLHGFRIVKNSRMIRHRDLTAIQGHLVGNRAGVRTQAGTVLKNTVGELVYVPPPPERVSELLANLLTFINEPNYSPLNPLVKMAVIHHQFESIHPFYDGNGRTGRILNLLYLVLAGKMDLPVLYLSRYIIQNKPEYYRLLQAVRTNGDWESWLLYMVRGIAETARQTVGLIRQINKELLHFKHRIRAEHPRLYSQDLINALFEHPYTKIAFVKRKLGCSYLTARNKLQVLCEDGLLRKYRVGRSNYYINGALVECLSNIHSTEQSL